MPPKWDNPENVLDYNRKLEAKLEALQPVTCHCDIDLQYVMDTHLDNINSAMHEATKEARCIPKSRSAPKPYWCPEFRKMSRKCMNNNINQHFNKLNGFSSKRKMSAFWNEVKRQKRTKVNSSLAPNDFSNFYSTIMTDTNDRTDEQLQDKLQVEEYYNQCKQGTYNHYITADQIGGLLDRVHRGKSPGIDGITAEHLIHGKSPTLCRILADLYSMMISRRCVQSVFHTGLIIPILKKSTLNPNQAKNYRPVTVSSIHTKLVEMTLVPDAEISDNQYGFRESRGTGMASS